MTYVISDLNGCFDKFEKLLEKIRFSDNDVLYVLGNIVDHGDKPMELLCDLSMRANVLPILGDCDYRAQHLLTELDKLLKGGSADPEVLGEMTSWITEGGQKTMEGFKALDDEMKEGVLEYFEDMLLYEELAVRGKKYLLVHAGIADFDPDTPLEDYMPEDFISEPLDPSRPLIDGVTVIAGHVPTSTGKIFYGDGCVLINCGAAFGGALGCLCLENGKEYYVE